MKQLLEQETEEKEALDKELQALKAKFEEQTAKYNSLVEQFKAEQDERKKDKENYEKQNKTEIKGLEVLRKNLDEHVEDLNRWMKYLDFDTQSELDFGELRQQIYQDISKATFDEQLGYLSTKLSKENEELLALLKQKEIEAKAKKANEKKKKDRQKSNE